MSGERTVAIVGGGILGSVLALRLAEAGSRVTLLEAAPAFGGLASTMDFGGHTVDRFYHVLTPADAHMIGLATELGLEDQLRFSPVGSGFFIDGEMHDFNGISDLLRFTPLTPIQRLRLGGSSPSANCERAMDVSTTFRSRSGCAGTAAGGSSTESGARCSTPASSATPRGCPPPISGHGRAGCHRRGRAAQRARPSAIWSAATSA